MGGGKVHPPREAEHECKKERVNKPMCPYLECSSACRSVASRGHIMRSAFQRTHSAQGASRWIDITISRCCSSLDRTSAHGTFRPRVCDTTTQHVVIGSISRVWVSVFTNANFARKHGVRRGEVEYGPSFQGSSRSPLKRSHFQTSFHYPPTPTLLPYPASQPLTGAPGVYGQLFILTSWRR